MLRKPCEQCTDESCATCKTRIRNRALAAASRQRNAAQNAARANEPSTIEPTTEAAPVEHETIVLKGTDTMPDIQKITFDYNGLDRDKARGLRQQATAIKAAIKRTQNDIIEIGNRLRDVRDDLEHGEFLNWISFEFSMSQRTAYNLMNVAETFSKVANFANLTFDKSALYALAAASVSDDTRAEAIAIAESGTPVTRAVAKDLIEAAKPHATPSFDKGDGVTWEWEGKTIYAEYVEQGWARGDMGQDIFTDRIICTDVFTGQTYEPDTKKIAVRKMTSEDWDDVADLREAAESSDDNDQDFEPEATPPSGVDGYGRPSPEATSKAANTSTLSTRSSTAKDDDEEEPTPTIEERIEALPLFQALSLYGHSGHFFGQQAAIWFEHEALFSQVARKTSSSVRHTKGPVTEAIRGLVSLPSPADWEGCAACKGSLRVGEAADPCQVCVGGFTTRKGEGVSADVVRSHASGD